MLIRRENIYLLVLIAICFMVEELMYPGTNLWVAASSILNHSLHLAMVALGVAMVISVGDIDLSAAGIISFTGTILILFAYFNMPPMLAWTLVMLAAVTVGLMHGLFISRFAVSPLVLTLGTSFALAGVATIIDLYLTEVAAEKATRTLPEVYQPGLLVPELLIVFYLTVLLFWRYNTRSGLIHLAVGLDREAATLAGLPVHSVRIRAFLVSALSSALASGLLLGYMHGGHSPRAGSGYELAAIAACVIGGTRLTGGYFSPITIVLSAILLRTIYHVLSASSLPPETEYLATGILLVVVAIIQSVVKN